MAVHGLNHAVLYVRDAERSARFYTDVLGFERVGEQNFRGAVFLRAGGSTNDHDLGLFSIGDTAADSTAGQATVGLYHLAWEVDTLGALREYGRALAEAGAFVGASNHGTTRSLYAKDPDGIEFEMVWVVPADLLHPDDKPGVRALDLDADVRRFGIDTPGGIGVSRQPSAVR